MNQLELSAAKKGYDEAMMNVLSILEKYLNCLSKIKIKELLNELEDYYKKFEYQVDATLDGQSLN